MTQCPKIWKNQVFQTSPEMGEPTSAMSALQTNTDLKNTFLSFPSRLPYTSFLEEMLSLLSVLMLSHQGSANL